ncbi:MAG: hypothetical protein Q4D57_06050 [Clostridia bacterium]|nr:hypothetical protein [Clostridia bacterium]
MNTSYLDVLNVFHSLLKSKFEIDEDLEYQWFLNALADYELELSELNYLESQRVFADSLPRYVVKTLGLIMYVNYLTQELSRVMKLNGIIGKDISLTGMDATKRVTLEELQSEKAYAEKLLHKQKQHTFN